MADYVESQLPSGATIRIEVASKTGAIQANRVTDMLANGTKFLNETLDTIREMSNSIIKTIEQLDILPKEIAVRFGVKIDAEVGAMVAKAGSEAQFEVTLTWKSR